jgi:hypothetical protein
MLLLLLLLTAAAPPDLDAELDLLNSLTWEELLASEVGTKDRSAPS